jgi:hypothetical protein
MHTVKSNTNSSNKPTKHLACITNNYQEFEIEFGQNFHGFSNNLRK